MRLAFVFYALAGFWFMVALCRAAKIRKSSPMCERAERIKISSKEFP